MSSRKTNALQQEAAADVRLDAVDRTLLGLLADDSTQSYATLGRALHLSPPAVHERVKRLKRARVIVRTAAQLDGARLGRPLLCFVQVITSTIQRTRQVARLSSLQDIEEIHTVTGDSGLLLKVRTRDTQALEALLAKIHDIEGVEGTRTQIAMSTLLERGPSPEGPG
jgi:Lrp/AsnC family transcriptional regulator, leucine-responsive regulatory protein